ncbi:hypothetical protein N9043_01030 [bacterium]|nr:hypothetical protein [bacterium]
MYEDDYEDFIEEEEDEKSSDIEECAVFIVRNENEFGILGAVKAVETIIEMCREKGGNEISCSDLEKLLDYINDNSY